MSESSLSPPPRTELETVVNWPLIYTAAGLVLVPLVVVTSCAVWTWLTAPPKPAEVAVQPLEAVPFVAVAPADPTHPSRVVLPVVQESTSEREVVIKVIRPQQAPDRKPAREPAVETLPVETLSVLPSSEEKPYKPLLRIRHRLNVRSEAELLADLDRNVPVLDLHTRKDAAGKSLATYLKTMRRFEAEKNPVAGLLAAVKGRADLAGLPFRMGKECLTGKEEAKQLGVLSREVRGLQVSTERVLRRRSAEAPVPIGFGDNHDKLQHLARLDREEFTHRAGAFEQMLQADSELTRSLLVNMLANNPKDRVATEALARRAVFDLSPVVREKAVHALRDRPKSEARPVLLAALRHPWPAAADHASEALVALKDREAIKRLEKILDEPDPREPFRYERPKPIDSPDPAEAPPDDEPRWQRRELVRVNHLRNCFLCHPPSTSPLDPVRGTVPVPGRPLSVEVYYEDEGEGGSVRADIVFLKQDFSVTHKVANPDKWPEQQRFDYLVRVINLTEREVEAYRAEVKKKGLPPTYPQREAVRFAIKGLKEADALARE